MESQITLGRRQARWLEFLSQFDYRVLYVKGDENVVSDALCRMIDGAPTAEGPPGEGD